MRIFFLGGQHPSEGSGWTYEVTFFCMSKLTSIVFSKTGTTADKENPQKKYKSIMNAFA